MTVTNPIDSATTAKGAGGKPRGRKILSWRLVPLLVALALAALAVWLCIFFVQRAGDSAKPLSQLEQAIFGVFSLLAGAGLSWLTSAYYSARQTRSQFQQLARPALRRVMAARDSAESVLLAIERRRSGEDKGKSDPYESLTSLYELVEQHARVLDDAIEDWQEVLPDEVRAVHAEERSKLFQALNLRLDDLDGKVGAIALASESGADIEKQVAALHKEIAELRSEARGAKQIGHRIGSNYLTPLDPSVRRLAKRSSPASFDTANYATQMLLEYFRQQANSAEGETKGDSGEAPPEK
ncbi:hypothetical protein ACQSSU_12990 [Micromonospora echinospora]